MGSWLAYTILPPGHRDRLGDRHITFSLDTVGHREILAPKRGSTLPLWDSKRGKKSGSDLPQPPCDLDERPRMSKVPRQERWNQPSPEDKDSRALDPVVPEATLPWDFSIPEANNN